MMRALVVALCAGAGALELAVVSLAVPKASERYGAAGRAWRWKSAVLGDDMAFPARALAEAAVAESGGAVAEAAALATCARLDVVVAGADGEAAAAGAPRAPCGGIGRGTRRRADRAGGEIAAAAAAGVPAGADAGDLDGAFATLRDARVAEHLALRRWRRRRARRLRPFSSRRAHVLKQVKACAEHCATDGAAAVRRADRSPALPRLRGRPPGGPGAARGRRRGQRRAHGPTLALRRGDAVDEAAVRAAIDRAVADAAR
ncbi:hypothetical protein JL721_8008 [Aureococcus anophagefferens]|nr:hypothetical protein JL721_8008 [Aureococcus anophagefferens]